MRIISILIRYCPHRYYQSYSCWPAASWCSLSPAPEKWWPPHCEQSSPCSDPRPGSTGTSPRPGESQEPGWGHSHRLTPSRLSSARTWCRCLFPGGQEKVNMRIRQGWRGDQPELSDCSYDPASAKLFLAGTPLVMQRNIREVISPVSTDWTLEISFLKISMVHIGKVFSSNSQGSNLWCFTF